MQWTVWIPFSRAKKLFLGAKRYALVSIAVSLKFFSAFNNLFPWVFDFRKVWQLSRAWCWCTTSINISRVIFVICLQNISGHTPTLLLDQLRFPSEVSPAKRRAWCKCITYFLVIFVICWTNNEYHQEICKLQNIWGHTPTLLLDQLRFPGEVSPAKRRDCEMVF